MTCDRYLITLVTCLWHFHPNFISLPGDSEEQGSAQRFRESLYECGPLLYSTDKSCQMERMHTVFRKIQIS